MNFTSKKSRPLLQERMRIFASFACIWLLGVLVVCGAEVIMNLHNLSSGDNRLSVILLKILNSLVFWIKTYVFLLLVFLAGSYYSVRAASRLAVTLILALVLIEVLLITYFSRSMVPLGADLFGYSFKEIMQTAGASGGVSVSGATLFVVLVIGLCLLFRLRTRSYIPVWLALALPAVSLLAWVAPVQHWLSGQNRASEFEANLVSDKATYFLSRSWDHFFPYSTGTDIYADSYAAQDPDMTEAPDFTYPDPAGFPFFHPDNCQDVLSPFFVCPDSVLSKRRPPSVVIILVEGLGRAFTNEGAYLGNFTPFIDSLAHHSLYWKNFLSEGGRTFAALPSLIASLPFGKNGFLEMGDKMPREFSLMNILKENGYHTSYYYGGNAHFDNMDIFLRKNGVDELCDEYSFPAGYTKLPTNNGFSWGYDDAAVYRRYLDTRRETDATPQMSIILTVSTHSPFVINDQRKYVALFEERMTRTGMDEQLKTQRRAFKDQYSSILYADDALRGFMTAYSKRADYRNTIFIITGDHRMPEIPMRSKIDRYHVPLILFSPLLKRTAEFQSVSTHFDLAPSLLAFLSSIYGLQRPSGVSWMGSGLDTARQFRNIHSYPLMQTKTDLLDFIAGEYHLSDRTLFRLSSDMNEEPVVDDHRKNFLEDGFRRFVRRNEQVMPGSKLVPDSSLLFLGK